MFYKKIASNSLIQVTSYLINFYFLSSFGKNAFNNTPLIAARAIAGSSKLMLSNFSIAPPTPKTMITDEITKFLLILRSTFSSTNILSPLDAIIPNSKIDTPPITGDGIVEIRAENLPTKLKISANNDSRR